MANNHLPQKGGIFNPLKRILGPAFDPAVVVGKALGNKLDKWIDQLIPQK